MEQKLETFEEIKKNFNAFIEEYKELPLIDKQQTLVNDLKEIIALFQELCRIYRIDYKLLVNREILDIKKTNYSEDDFVEAIYVYIQMFKDVLSNFLLQTMLDEDNNQEI